MAKSNESSLPQSRSERLALFGRNVNILGAVALGGVAVVLPGPNVVIGTLASINAVQAAGFELWRSHAKNKQKKARL